MHNTPKHRDGARPQRAQVNTVDARAAGLSDGDFVRVVSAAGAIELPVELTDDLAPGVVSVPHGWGHAGGGWTVANAAGGVNVNEITPSRPETLERLSGMAHLNGVPVRIEAVAAAGQAPVDMSVAGAVTTASG
jgi:formate dehydrogenase